MAPVDAAPMEVVPVEDGIVVDCVCALGPQHLLQRRVTLPAGATVRQALLASGLLQEVQAVQAEQTGEGDLLGRLEPSLWGRACSLEAPLQHGDRVALTRPLTVDPKEARRLRYRRDGLKPRRRLKAAPASASDT